MSDGDRDAMNSEWIEKMRADYNAPPHPPRDEMWRVIERKLDGADEGVIPITSRLRARPRRYAPWIVGAMAAAALLVLGVGLGRMSVTAPGASMAGTDRMQMDPVRTAALRHLSRSESFLALVRSDARAGQVDQEVGRWGQSLLLETRLLMDSEAGDSRVMLRLLEDLELILAQVAQFSGSEAQGDVLHAEEMSLIAEAMEARDLMMRIRSVLPSGVAQAGL